jgi:hypothetical protein
MAERESALRVLAALRRSPVADAAVLVDAGAEGYAPVLRQVEAGLERLLSLLERLHG